MSGIKISNFKKPATIIVDQAKVDSAYGPRSSILLEKTASSYSKSGFTIEIQGLSRDALLNGLFVSIPIQIRWVGGKAGTQKLLLNQYPDQELGIVMGADGDANLFTDENVTDTFRSYDNVCVRPNPFKCIRNATLSVNGSSFSTRPDAYFTGMSKLFCDGRKEQITGGDYERYPYTNSGYRDQQGYQKGWYERCKSLNTMGKVVHTGFNGNKLNDIVYQYDIKFPIFFGPFTHQGFPGLTSFDGQSVSSFPYFNDVVLECTFTDDVIMDAFACSDTELENALAVNNPKALALSANGNAVDMVPNTKQIWDDVAMEDIAKSTSTQLCGLQAPKLCYMFSEPDSDKMQIAPVYTLPSYRFIAYESRVAIPAGQETVDINFPYIRLSNISALYMVYAEAARVDMSATAVAARQSKGVGAGYQRNRLGPCCANRTCPIKWDTVNVSMSTNSTVLTNFSKNTITPQRQFELFKKYSNNAMGLTFEEWQESSQMLLFSAEELCGIGAFSNSFQSLTLSVKFQVYRDAADTKLRFSDYISPQGASGIAGRDKGLARGVSLIGRLVCLEPELVSVSEGAVSVEMVKLSQAEIHNQLMGGAPEVEDAVGLDELAR